MVWAFDDLKVGLDFRVAFGLCFELDRGLIGSDLVLDAVKGGSAWEIGMVTGVFEWEGLVWICVWDLMD